MQRHSIPSHAVHEEVKALTKTGWPGLARTHLSPARDTMGSHLPLVVVVVLAVGGLPLPLAAVVVIVAAVGLVVAAVGGDAVVVVVVALVGAGAGLGPPLSSVRPLRAAWAEAASRLSAEIRRHACACVHKKQYMQLIMSVSSCRDADRCSAG
jgi:hypothetical protein